MKRYAFISGLVLIGVMLCDSTASGQGYVAARSPATPPPASQPVYELTVQPAAEPDPPLKYRLLPAPVDQESGNALALMLRASESAGDEGLKKFHDKLSEWVSMPAKDMPRAEVDEMLKGYAQALELLRMSSRYETANWDIPIRTQGIGAPMPSLTRFRDLARVLAIRARIAMSEGRFDDAVADLRTGFTMAKHLSGQKIIIGDLVSIAIDNILMEQVRELVQQPGAPNMYWALAQLPRPLTNISESMGYELSMVYFSFPELKHPENLSAEQAQATFAKVRQMAFGPLGYGVVDPQDKLRSAMVAIKAYPEAKKFLLSKGYSRQKVEAMPVAQAIMIYNVYWFERWTQQMNKWNSLPFWQAREGMRKTNEEMDKSVQGQRGLVPLADLMPSLGLAQLLVAKADRRVAAMMTIEAVRMYAAAHDGKVPASLDDLIDAPAPMDPMTGKAFSYKVEGDNKFVIDAPAPAGEMARMGEKYVVTIKK